MDNDTHEVNFAEGAAPPISQQGSLDGDIASGFPDRAVDYVGKDEVPDFTGQIKVTRWRPTTRDNFEFGGKVVVEFEALKLSLYGLDLVIHRNSHPRVNMARRTCMGNEGLYVGYVGAFWSRAAREAFSFAVLDSLYNEFPETQDAIRALLPKRYSA